MADTDVSFYKEAANASPFDFQNQLLDNQARQQAVQENAIKLATERFGAINNAASGLLSDPDLGQKDITGKLWDTLGRLTKGDAMTAQHAVQFMQQFPTDPRQQAQAIKNVHAQTLDAWQKGLAYMGQTQPQDIGGGIQYNRTPAFGGQPQNLGFIPKTLAPGTEVTNPNDFSKSYTGGTGNPGIMPPVNGAPARAKVPSTNRLIGDDEAIQSGLYPAPPGSKSVAQANQPLMAEPSPGAKTPQEESGLAYAKDLANSREYPIRMTPLREVIPLLEKTKTGPGQEVFQKIGAVAQTLGLPIPNPDQVRDYAKAQKYLAQNAAMAAPPGTNIPSVINAFESNPNLHQPNQAAVDLSKVLYGLGRMKDASVRAFQAARKQDPRLQPGDYTDWSSQWSRSQDPRAYVADLLTPEQRADLSKSIKPGSSAAKKFRASFETAKSLGLLGDVEGHEIR